MNRLLLSFLAFSAIAQADFDAARWPFRRPLTVKGTEGVAQFPIQPMLYKGSRGRLQDFRIVHGGAEAPYILRTLAGSEEVREFRAKLVNNSVVPGVGVQAMLDLGSHASHNRLRIATEQRNFKQRVRIETSDDGRNWALVRDDGYIFDFSQDGTQFSSLTVDYPVSTRRFVRLTILGWTSPQFLGSAWLTYSKESPGTRDTVATLTPVIAQDRQAKTTLVTGDIGFEGLPYDRVTLEVDPGLFYRDVEVSTSSDGQNWSVVGQGVVSRTADHTGLTIPVSEQWLRYIRLTVFNEDNPPVTVRRMELSSDRRVLMFPVAAGGEYWLYYGNAEARQPTYDFAQTLPERVNAVTVSVGEESKNPDYREPSAPEKPWSDRHPGLLYTVLIAAVLGMGFVAFRMLMKTKSGSA